MDNYLEALGRIRGILNSPKISYCVALNATVLSFIEETLNHFDRSMRENMVKYYIEHFTTREVYYADTNEGEQAMRCRLTADKFWIVLKDLYFFDIPSVVGNLLCTREKRALLGIEERMEYFSQYASVLQKIKGVSGVHQKELFPYSAIRMMKDYPELCASPDAWVKVKRKEGGVRKTQSVLVIFHDPSKVSHKSLKKVLGTGNVVCSGKHIRNEENVWYEVLGLFEAFNNPNEMGEHPTLCHYVIIKEGRCAIVEIDENNDRIRQLSEEKGELFDKMRKFYIGALLPEVAHSRGEQGLDLRKELLDDTIINQITSQCAPTVRDADDDETDSESDEETVEPQRPTLCF